MIKSSDIRYCDSFAQELSLEHDQEQFFECVKILKKDTPKGLSLLIEMAKSGSSLSACFVGDICVWGYNGVHNLEVGLGWLHQASSNGSLEGTYQLARTYWKMEKIEESINLFEKLALKNFTPAMFNLGGLYFSQKDMPNSRNMSRKYYEMAADMGHILANKNISIQLIKGEYGFYARFEGFYRWMHHFRHSMRTILESPESDLLRGSSEPILGSSMPNITRATLMILDQL